MGEYNAVATEQILRNDKEKQNQIGALSFHPMKLLLLKALGQKIPIAPYPESVFKTV